MKKYSPILAVKTCSRRKRSGRRSEVSPILVVTKCRRRKKYSPMLVVKTCRRRRSTHNTSSEDMQEEKKYSQY